jgi:hypothetical protein
MELTHQLIPKLKPLRLSGVLATLEARHRQAINGQWAYVECLERWLEDEIERRAQNNWPCGCGGPPCIRPKPWRASLAL